jgi:hypothetical protein
MLMFSVVTFYTTILGFGLQKVCNLLIHRLIQSERRGLKIRWPQGRVGSIPSTSTN